MYVCVCLSQRVDDGRIAGPDEPNDAIVQHSRLRLVPKVRLKLAEGAMLEHPHKETTQAPRAWPTSCGM